jgi:hypothetical protein
VAIANTGLTMTLLWVVNAPITHKFIHSHYLQNIVFIMSTNQQQKIDNSLLDDFDQEFNQAMHAQVPEQEPDYDRPSLIERATEHVQAITDVQFKLANAIAFAPIVEASYDSKSEEHFIQENLFGEAIPVEPSYERLPVLLGQDIVDIRALTGKRQDQAKAALHAAAVEMLDKASPDCFYIPTNVASSKNSKEIGFYLNKNPATGKNDKINILVDSAVTQKYRKATAGYWLQNKVAFLNQVRDLPIPISIEFTFIRDSMRRSDFLNMAQVLCDLMVSNGYIPDDDTCNIHPVFSKIVYYHPSLAGVLFRVIK